MDVTRRCDYACRILRQAHRAAGSFVSIAEVAEKEDIPYAFARSIQHDLAAEGLIETARGPHGGLRLKADLDETTLLDVMSSIQGEMAVAPCTADAGFCSKSNRCAYHRVWEATDKLLGEFYGSITLSELLESGGSLPLIDRILAGGALCAG